MYYRRKRKIQREAVKKDEKDESKDDLSKMLKNILPSKKFKSDSDELSSEHEFSKGGL